MYKMRTVLLALIIIIISLFGGCEMKKTDSTEIFKKNADSFERVAEFLNVESICSEITTDRPPLFASEKHQKIGKLFYFYDEKVPELDEKQIKDIETLFGNCSLVRILVFKEEEIVLFQTESRLGGGKYIIYTKFGKECSDEYIQVIEWISKTWYIAKS